MKLLISLSLLFFFQTLSFGAQTYFCTPEFENIPIRQSGRIKPLYVHAKESLYYLTGKKKVDDYGAVMAYCLLSLNSLELNAPFKLQARIDHVKLKELLEVEEGKNTLPFEDLTDQISLLRLELRKNQVPDAYNKSVTKLINQINLYQNIVNGDNWLVPAVTRDRVDWIPFKHYFREDVINELKEKHQNPFLFSLQDATTKFEALKPQSTHKLEFLYAKSRLPQVAFLLTLLALASLTLFKNFLFTLLFSGSTLAVQIGIIVIRVFISGRAPITNMYETVMFSGFGALFLAMIVGHLKKEKVFVYMGLMYNLCTLMMMNFATSMLSESISPLVPVLRDNFWLSTHVTTIILSYGALALSWILANTVLIKNRFSLLSSKDLKHYSEQVYSCLKYGTVLLGAGIILGGVWADYSWGRFWGWDPKETWSLIAFIIYMAILHGRYTAWISNQRFIPLVALAFMSIMMAWFGVNYILASGLHSYGFSEGGAIFLGSFFVIQIAIVLLCSFKANLSQEKANA